MAITIRVTPRTIERIVMILLILVFMSSTIYYSYTCDKCTETAAEETTEETIEETAEETTTEETTKTETTETTTEETKKDTTTQKTTTTGSTSYKDVEITIGPLRYRIKESGVYKKAVIETMAFIVKNKMAKDIKDMKIEIYFWDSSSSEGFKTHPKDTLTFGTIKTGTASTRSFDVKNINLYNFDLTKNFKFVFLEGNETIKTVSKTLKIEE